MEWGILQHYIEKFQLNRVLPPEMLEHIVVSTFKKGEQIITQGEQPKDLSFLIEGRLKVFAASDEGKKLIIAFIEPFNMLGDIEFVQQKPYLNTVEAITDGKLLKVPL